MTWKGQHVLVTGGASFIGSHLVDALVAKGANVRVVDNLSSGRRENLATHLEQGAIELVEGDLLDPGVADRADPRRRHCLSPGRRPWRPWLRGSSSSGLRQQPAPRRDCVSRMPEGRRRQGRLCLVRLCVSEPSANRRQPIAVPDRGHGRPALRRRQHVRLGEADGGTDAQGLPARTGA